MLEPDIEFWDNIEPSWARKNVIVFKRLGERDIFGNLSIEILWNDLVQGEIKNIPDFQSLPN